MGNKQAQKTDQLIDQERSRQLEESDYARSYLEPERASEKSFADSLRGDITSGYRGLVTGEGLAAPGTYSAGIGGGGGSAPVFSLNSAYKKLEPRYNTLSGGIDQALGGYREFANTGGISNEMRDRIRGSGVFDDMAATGGYTNADMANVRSRGIAPISAFYGNLKNELDKKRAVQGGYGFGYDATSAKMARDNAIAGGNAARDTEIDLSQSIRGNKMQGASALSGAELGYTNALQSGKLAGLGGMTDIGKFGYGGLQDIAGIRQQISNANASARSAASNSRAAGSRAEAAAIIEEQQYRDKMKLAGLGGLESVYGSNPAELARYDEELYRNRGLTGQNVGQSLGQRQANIQPSGWDRAAQWGSLAAGVGAAAFTGGASMAIPSAVNKKLSSNLAGLKSGGYNAPFAGSPSYSF